MIFFLSFQIQNEHTTLFSFRRIRCEIYGRQQNWVNKHTREKKNRTANIKPNRPNQILCNWNATMTKKATKTTRAWVKKKHMRNTIIFNSNGISPTLHAKHEVRVQRKRHTAQLNVMQYQCRAATSIRKLLHSYMTVWPKCMITHRVLCAVKCWLHNTYCIW